MIYPYTSAGFCRDPTPKCRRRIWGRTPCDLANKREVMGVLRPASWQPLEPLWRSTIMDHVSQTTSPYPWYYQTLSHIVYQTVWILWELNAKHMRKHDPSKVFGCLYYLLVDFKHEDKAIKHGDLRYCRTKFHRHIYPTIEQLPVLLLFVVKCGMVKRWNVFP